MSIHETTIISKNAQIASDAEVGAYCVIEEGAKVGAGSRIGHHVVIHSNVVIGDSIRVDDHSVLGKLPMRAAMSAITRDQVLEPCEIEDGCLIGSGAILYRGSKLAKNVMVADLATIREEVQIGEFTIIGRGVTVENRCSIGRRCKIETEAYITALSEIADYCFVSPEVTFTNDNVMGRTEERFKHHLGVILECGARVGANATVLPGIRIKEDGVVAAGSVVTRDVPSRQIVLGIPARVWKPVPESQWVIHAMDPGDRQSPNP